MVLVLEWTACAEVSTQAVAEPQVGSFTAHLPSVITEHDQSANFLKEGRISLYSETTKQSQFQEEHDSVANIYCMIIIYLISC